MQSTQFHAVTLARTNSTEGRLQGLGLEIHFAEERDLTTAHC